MLLFLAEEPTAQNEKDGMSQRIKWVDEQFMETPRVILQVSMRRNLRRTRVQRSRTLVVEHLNLFLHFPRFLYLVRSSNVTYVHSCHNALQALPLYFLSSRIVTDMHGTVPEEIRSNGLTWSSRLMSIVERIVVRRSAALVVVTDAMRHHFSKKYNLKKDSPIYIVPIVPLEASSERDSVRNSQLVIYAGGLQMWQRVDRMLDAVERARDRFHYLFLTGDPETLRRELGRRHISNVSVDSVPRAKIFEHYAHASFGFILREDTLVNRVACPTKLSEYLWHGVIPIVEQPYIGDFAERGYNYVLVEDFMEGNLPSPEVLNNMREHNRMVVRELADFGASQFEIMRRNYAGVSA